MITFQTIADFYNHKIARAFDVPGAAVGGGAGHMIADKEITGIMGVDVFIKVVVPIVSGLLVPVIREWLQDRREARALRRAELEAKQTEQETE